MTGQSIKEIQPVEIALMHRQAPRVKLETKVQQELSKNQNLKQLARAKQRPKPWLVRTRKYEISTFHNFKNQAAGQIGCFCITSRSLSTAL